MMKFMTANLTVLALSIGTLCASSPHVHNVVQTETSSNTFLKITSKYEHFALSNAETLYLDSEKPLKAVLNLPKVIDDLILTTDLEVFCDRLSNISKDLVYLAPVEMAKKQAGMLPNFSEILEKCEANSYVFLFAFGGQTDLNIYDATSLSLSLVSNYALDCIWETTTQRKAYEPKPGYYLGSSTWGKIKISLQECDALGL